MNDIVQRLRADADVIEKSFGQYGRAQHIREAAARIKALEAALRLIADWEPIEGLSPPIVARRALEGKDG